MFVCTVIAQFRYIKIQPKTIDLSTRLPGIKYRVCGIYSQEPRSDVYFLGLNFKISKLGYYCSIFIRTEISNDHKLVWVVSCFHLKSPARVLQQIQKYKKRKKDTESKCLINVLLLTQNGMLRGKNGR